MFGIVSPSMLLLLLLFLSLLVGAIGWAFRKTTFRKENLKILIIGVIVAAIGGVGLMLALNSNSQHPSALVGKWKVENRSYSQYDFELFKDGTAIWGGDSKWKVENGRLHIIGAQRALSLDYTVSYSRLEISGDGLFMISGAITLTKQ